MKALNNFFALIFSFASGVGLAIPVAIIGNLFKGDKERIIEVAVFSALWAWGYYFRLIQKQFNEKPLFK